MNHRTSRRSIRRFAAAGALAAVVAPALSVAAAGSASAATSCTYNVSGKVVTTDNRLFLEDTFFAADTTDVLAADTPLAGAKVRVSTSWSGVGMFDVWSEKTLASDGSFSFSKTWTGAIDCSFKRDLKVDVQFEDSDLKIGSSPWYTVKKDSGAARAAGSYNLGTLKFKEGGANDAGDSDARFAAETWVVVSRAMDLLSEDGVPYTEKITVHNPNRTVTSWVADDQESSYADPLLGMSAYIAAGDADEAATVLHEIGHLWAYQHSTGEDCLAGALLADASTHDATENSCVAFHEGFAAYFSDKLQEELVDDGDLNGNAAYSGAMTRFALSNLGTAFSWLTGEANIDNLSGVQTSEFGWQQVFRVLNQQTLGSRVFGDRTTGVDTDGNGDTDDFVLSPGISIGSVSAPTGVVIGSGSTCTRSPNLSFAEVLRIFGSNLDTSAITVEDLLTRADSKLSNFSSTDASNYKTLIDPAKTAEPSSMYC